MKHILITCIPVLALAAAPCGAAGQPPSPAEQAAAADPDMGAAVARVKQALQEMKDGAARQAAVSAHADTIIVTGTAGSDVDAQRISETAQRAAGTVRVSSQIEVDAARQAAARQKSAALLREVEDALQRDGATAELRLLVTVDDQQKVLLFGPVPSREARAAAGRVAARVPGVTRVDNRLAVPD